MLPEAGRQRVELKTGGRMVLENISRQKQGLAAKIANSADLKQRTRMSGGGGTCVHCLYPSTARGLQAMGMLQTIFRQNHRFWCLPPHIL